MKLKIKHSSLFGLLLGLCLFSCSNAANEKAAREAAEKEEEGFHLNISTKDGDVKIDASGKGDKKMSKDKDGFHLRISTDDGDTEINGEDLINSKDLEEGFKNFDLQISGSGAKLDAKVLRNLFPERIGWFKRSEYNFQNALGLMSNAEVAYTKGNQKVTVVVMGGALGNIAGSFDDFFDAEFDLEDSDIQQKTGEWNGLKYVEGYDESEKKAFMHMVVDNRIMVMVVGENMSAWNFNWWWKRLDWKKLEQ